MLNKALSVILGLAIICAIGAIACIALMPKVGEKFTEFYVIGLDGKADDYPREVKLGQEAKVILGMVNHEYENTSYRVEVTIDGLKNSEIGPVVLADKEKWEKQVSFIPTNIGENRKVEFLLYKTDQMESYLSLRLWIDVKQ